MGETWTFDFDPLVIFPYATDSMGKEELGSLFTRSVCRARIFPLCPDPRRWVFCGADSGFPPQRYAEGVIKGLEEYEKITGDAGVNEVNTICYAHAVTMDYPDETYDHFIYCASDVKDGKLRIIFKDRELGSDPWGALRDQYFDRALWTAAPAVGLPMSYLARTYIRLEYDAKIEEVREKIAKQLDKPDIKLAPQFEQIFEKLKAAEKKRGSNLFKNFEGTWERDLGHVVRRYYEGLEYNLRRNNFGTDDLLREGFQDAVDKGVIVVRVVDKLKTDRDDAECVIEDGLLYLQVSLVVSERGKGVVPKIHRANAHIGCCLDVA